MKLYDNELSGNCYRIRLLLNQLGMDYEKVNVDIFKGEHKTDEFKKLNPNQKLPVLEDGDFVLWESIAVLIYLAKKYSPNKYFSEEPEKFGEIVQWVTFSKTTIDPYLALARFFVRFLPEEKVDKKELRRLQDNGMNALDILENQLRDRSFLTGAYTIADMSCYPYIKLSPEGGIDLSEFPNVLEWIERIENTENFIPVYESSTRD